MKSGTDSPTLFRTPVAIPLPPRLIGVGDTNVCLGSCFAEHIGRKFAESRFPALVNPMGVLYNPLSIARLLTIHAANAEEDFVQHDGLWHTWLGDSELSRPTHEACLQATETALHTLHTTLRRANHLFLTFGTSRVYLHESRIVANCHRVPQRLFQEHEASTEEMALALGDALESLWQHNPALQVVLTVSPYRYAKYGFHGSQLSKARLLLVVDELCRRHPDRIAYFPAYEIVLDELRDYRFYAEDMLHPSAQAVDYIWQRLCQTWMTEETKEYLMRWDEVQKALNHRPLHPESETFQQFRNRLSQRIERLKADYPHLRDMDIETEHQQL